MNLFEKKNFSKLIGGRKFKLTLHYIFKKEDFKEGEEGIIASTHCLLLMNLSMICHHKKWIYSKKRIFLNSSEAENLNWHSIIFIFQVLRGNSNTYLVEKQKLDLPFVASRVRFVPYSQHPRTVCMRVEIYGCVWNREYYIYV